MTKWPGYIAVFLVVVVGLASGCGKQGKGSSKAKAPAKVAHTIPENQLNTIVLTSEAEKRLGLETAKVEKRKLHRRRVYAGEVTLPTNAVLTVSAPVGGTLQVPKGHKLPQVGAVVDKGQLMFKLVPHVLTQAERVALAQAKLQLAQARVDAEGQVKQAKVQVEAAKIAFDRAERLYRDKAGIKKDIDDAEAQLLLAQKMLDAALLRKSLADSVKLDTDAESVKPLVLSSPRKGIVRATYAVAGEMIPTGSPLFEIMNVEKVWIKVPVYVGEAGEIAADKPAVVKNLADSVVAWSEDRASTGGVLAQPVPTPPTAQPQASAVDLYYELPNPERKYRPGERVSALLTLKSDANSLGVPASAIVYDIHGGSWVYAQTAPRTYARQRVQVRYIVDGWAVLKQGPPAGTPVVSVAAAELFGTEFGFSH